MLLVRQHCDDDIALQFFDSVYRRVFLHQGIAVEYVDERIHKLAATPYKLQHELYTSYYVGPSGRHHTSLEDSIRSTLAAANFLFRSNSPLTRLAI